MVVFSVVELRSQKRHILLPNGFVDELIDEVLVEISMSSWRCLRTPMDKRQIRTFENTGPLTQSIPFTSASTRSRSPCRTPTFGLITPKSIASASSIANAPV